MLTDKQTDIYTNRHYCDQYHPQLKLYYYNDFFQNFKTSFLTVSCVLYTFLACFVFLCSCLHFAKINLSITYSCIHYARPAGAESKIVSLYALLQDCVHADAPTVTSIMQTHCGRPTAAYRLTSRLTVNLGFDNDGHKQ